MSWQGSYGGWAPYVPVAQRRAKAARYAESLAKKEKRTLAPVKIEGRKIAKSFWGLAWCENLERYSDYANRLPRGGTYVRNGSVIDLQISKGMINAIVSGSEVYSIKIKINTLAPTMWSKIKQDCAQSIDSLLDLLQGKFDRGIMERLSLKEGGLFPIPKEIQMSCSCPDSAGLCKHIAATMYGVGHRLDSSPELLFLLRAVDHLELINDAISKKNLDRTFGSDQENALAGSDLGELFGIELDHSADAPNDTTKPTKKVLGTAKKTISQKPTKPVKRVASRKKVSAASEIPPAKSARKVEKSSKPIVLSTKSIKATSSTKAKSAVIVAKVIALSKRKGMKDSKPVKATPKKPSRQRLAK